MILAAIVLQHREVHGHTFFQSIVSIQITTVIYFTKLNNKILLRWNAKDKKVEA